MIVTRDTIANAAARHVNETDDNRIASGVAISAEMAGLRLYDAPIAAFGDADDPLFQQLKDRDVIGPHFMTPGEWLPGAATVVSLFLPASAAVRADNRADMALPSPGWLHARIEGQVMIRNLTKRLVALLVDAGYAAVAPMLDDRLLVNEGKPSQPDHFPRFSSTWSERHVAYVCGLGTFGLSKGLITRRGVAGRFTSVVTTLALPHDRRDYADPYEYCSLCGACARNCPAGAISVERGKDHQACSEFLDRMLARFAPRYGCGKCQVGVPCEGRMRRIAKRPGKAFPRA